MIFVTVGTADFDFSRLLEEVDRIAKDLDEKVVIQKGETDYNPKNCETYDFVEKSEFDSYVKNSRLVITHAGVGALLTCLNYGKKPIVVPRRVKYGEHVDDHQIEIAEKFSEKYGLATVGEIKELENTLEDAEGNIETEAEKELVNYLKDLLDSFNQ